MYFKSRGMGRFLAVLHLRTGDSTFTVVETNQFKHLSHLSLVFRQGNDNVIKQFLAGRLAEYKVYKKHYCGSPKHYLPRAIHQKSARITAITFGVLPVCRGDFHWESYSICTGVTVGFCSHYSISICGADYQRGHAWETTANAALVGEGPSWCQQYEQVSTCTRATCGNKPPL